MTTETGRRRRLTQVGLAVALTLGAIGAGYVAGKTSGNRLPAGSVLELSHGMAHPGTISAEARVEGLLLFLLGREGVL